jgi:DUF4097 and DUF4098 domain-containing protein YvlB
MKLGARITFVKVMLTSLLAIGVMVMAAGCIVRPIGWSRQKVSINQDERISIENLKRIIVGTASADIKVVATDEKELRFHYYGDVRIASSNNNFAPYIDKDESGSSLVLMEKISNGLNSVSYSGNVKLDIYVPKGYPEEIKLNTASGKINISNFEGSGDINTASGDIAIENCRGSFSANTASGHINYKKDSVLNNNITLNSISGGIDINIAKSSGFVLKARTVSGKIRCDFPVVLNGRGAEGTVGDGKNNISINTVSGSIAIRDN